MMAQLIKAALGVLSYRLRIEEPTRDRNVPSADTLHLHAALTLRSAHRTANRALSTWGTGGGRRAGGVRGHIVIGLASTSLLVHTLRLRSGGRGRLPVFILPAQHIRHWERLSCTKADYASSVPKKHREMYCTRGARWDSKLVTQTSRCQLPDEEEP